MPTLVEPAAGRAIYACRMDVMARTKADLRQDEYAVQSYADKYPIIYNHPEKEFKTLQTFMIAAMIYWALTIIFSTVQNRIEKRLAAGDRNKESKG